MIGLCTNYWWYIDVLAKLIVAVKKKLAFRPCFWDQMKSLFQMIQGIDHPNYKVLVYPLKTSLSNLVFSLSFGHIRYNDYED